MTTSKEDFSSIPDGAWQLWEEGPGFRRWICHLDDDRSVMKTEYLANDDLIKLNQEELHDSQTKRFGDGRVVARVPLNVFYGSESEITKKLKEGDHDHIRWWLNSEQAKPWRNFRGKV